MAVERLSSKTPSNAPALRKNVAGPGLCLPLALGLDELKRTRSTTNFTRSFAFFQSMRKER